MGISAVFCGICKREMLKYTAGADPDEDRDGRLYSMLIGYIYPSKRAEGSLI